MGKGLGRSRLSLRDLCAMRGWSERSFYRGVDSAAGAVAVRLNRAGVALGDSLSRYFTYSALQENWRRMLVPDGNSARVASTDSVRANCSSLH